MMMSDVGCWPLAITRAQQLEAEVDMSVRLEAAHKAICLVKYGRTREKKKTGRRKFKMWRKSKSRREKSHCSRPCLVKTYAMHTMHIQCTRCAQQWYSNLKFNSVQCKINCNIKIRWHRGKTCLTCRISNGFMRCTRSAEHGVIFTRTFRIVLCCAVSYACCCEVQCWDCFRLVRWARKRILGA